MGIFSKLEGTLEKHIEGFFKDKFKGRVQPVEVAKRLAREMRNKRRVSVDNVYVPNEYKVLLHPEDWKSIGAFNKLLSLELQDYLVQKATKKDFTLVGPPLVTIAQSTATTPGHIQVQTTFKESILPMESPQISTTAAIATEQGTQKYQPVKDTSSLISVKQKMMRLVIKSGPDTGKEFSLENRRLIIGRRESCDIVLTDLNVSRKHAQLDCHASISEALCQCVLTDLQSTNGTLVNGKKITKQLLEFGDVIIFGNTECIIEK
ncbi:DUF3662 domain-containing protein [Peptococcaceae bacterium]|nr:DUF3662 domain-containing protein [Peptococcaceae bacterium]